MPYRKKFRLAAALLGLGVLLLIAILAAPPDMLAETFAQGFSQRIAVTRVPNDQILAPINNSSKFAFLEEIGWEMTDVYVVSPGRTAVMTEGTFHEGFVIQSRVTNANYPDFTTGILEMQLSAFSPIQDMPGQQAGKWYIHGEWQITDAGAGPAVTAFRYGPHTVKGVVNLELGYNPLIRENHSLFLSRPVRFAASGPGTSAESPQAALIGNTRFSHVYSLTGSSPLAPAMEKTEEGR
ncbi:MAG: hypothetical protein KC425_12930 [Anaerolineales bacterium]|nr:hypothetical protein [Anaerolineales bacterium]